MDDNAQAARMLLQDGITINFAGKEWRLIAGAEIERLLREEHKDCGVEGSFENFLEWAVSPAGGDIGNHLPASLNLFDDDGETFSRLQGGVIELLSRYTHRNDDHAMLPMDRRADQ